MSPPPVAWQMRPHHSEAFRRPPNTDYTEGVFCVPTGHSSSCPNAQPQRHPIPTNTPTRSFKCNGRFIRVKPPRRGTKISTGFQHFPVQAKLKLCSDKGRYYPRLKNIFHATVAGRHLLQDELCNICHPQVRSQSWSHRRAKFKKKNQGPPSTSSYHPKEQCDPAAPIKPWKIMNGSNGNGMKPAKRKSFPPPFDS